MGVMHLCINQKVPLSHFTFKNTVLPFKNAQKMQYLNVKCVRRGSLKLNPLPARLLTNFEIIQRFNASYIYI